MLGSTAVVDGALVLRRTLAVSCMLLLSLLVAPQASAQDHAPGIDKHFIIGGQQVEQGGYPWLVALTYNFDQDLFQRQFCGASIIADTWVLTAAHCLFDSRGEVLTVNDFKVAINAANLEDPEASELPVTNFFIHPSYNHSANNPHSDIAVLELATSSGITPVKLSTKPSDVLTGLQATVIGWGATDISDEQNPLFPVWSHSVDVPIVSLDVCNAPQSYANSIYENQLCAGYIEGGRDSCIGDSGGPMVVTFEGEVQQAGVVSFGYGCAQPNFYGVYSDVPYFIGWINQYVFVGEPEFEPETIIPRNTNSGFSGASSNDAAGGTSLFGLVLLGIGALYRRRK